MKLWSVLALAPSDPRALNSPFSADPPHRSVTHQQPWPARQRNTRSWRP